MKLNQSGAPSSIFDEYVLKELNGVPFFPRSSAWQTHLISAFESPLAAYGPSDVRKVNSYGQVLSFNMGYALYGGETYIENLPGAIVDNYKGNKIIVLHINLFAHLWSLAADLMSCNEFLPEIGDPGANGMPLKEEGHLFGFLPFLSPDFDILGLQVATRSTTCSVRNMFSIVFRDLMIESIINHEIGHIICGHIDFEISDREDYGDRNIFRALMEQEADNFAAKLFAARIGSGMRFGIEKEFNLTNETWITVHFLARYFVSYTLLVCDAMTGQLKTNLKGVRWSDYPPSILRIFNTFPSYYSMLVDELGIDVVTVNRAIQSADGQIRNLVQKYNCLSILKLGWDYDQIRWHARLAAEYSTMINMSKILEPYRYFISPSDSAMDLTKLQKNLHENRLTDINSLAVSTDLLREALFATKKLRPNDLGEFYCRAEAIINYFKPKNFDDELSMALIYRLEQLAKLAPDGSPFGVASTFNMHGHDISFEQLLTVASEIPLSRSAEGSIIFDNSEFWKLALNVKI